MSVETEALAKTYRLYQRKKSTAVPRRIDMINCFILKITREAQE
jgi:hypothetical protein